MILSITIIICFVVLSNMLLILWLLSIKSHIDIIEKAVEQLQDREIERLNKHINILKDKTQ